MSESDRFSGIARRIRKNIAGADGPDALQQLRDAFVSCLPDLPGTSRTRYARVCPVPCRAHAPTRSSLCTVPRVRTGTSQEMSARASTSAEYGLGVGAVR